MATWQTLAGGAALAVAATVIARAETPLVTGEASYDVSLAEPDAAGALVGLTGRMVVALTEVCDAYRMEVELSAVFEAVVGGGLAMQVWSSHVESETSLEFDLYGDLGAMEIDRARGVAVRENGGVSVDLAEPRQETLAFDGNVLFPLAVTRAAIAAARNGGTMAEFRIYDGSGYGRDVWILSVLIADTPPSADDPSADALFAAGLGFADLERWRMRFSYFPPGGTGDLTPAFSTEAIVYENGFTQAAIYDFGQFSLKLDLAEFRPLDPEPC